MADTFKILGIAGSLREKSFNRALLEAAKGLAPEGMTIEITDISQIPLYNEDVRTDGFPGAVTELGRQIAEADGVLIATPEYNYSVPGVLKNAIDWASRLPEQPFKDKPVAIMGAAAGRLGTARAQYHLRQVFVFLDALVMNRPEVMVGAAYEAFNDDGSIKDETTAGFVREQLETFARWIERVRD